MVASKVTELLAERSQAPIRLLNISEVNNWRNKETMLLKQLLIAGFSKFAKMTVMKVSQLKLDL